MDAQTRYVESRPYRVTGIPRKLDRHTTKPSTFGAYTLRSDALAGKRRAKAKGWINIHMRRHVVKTAKAVKAVAA